MPTQNSINTKVTNNADGFDVAGGTTARKLTVSAGDVAIAGSGSAVITFPSTTSTLATLGANVFTGAQQVTTIELGHATDTTLARVSAGVASIEGNNIITSGGALGTPSAGTLTSCTGLPIAGLVASTSTAIGVGSIELGHATDTSITRVSAGVVAIEGVNIVTTSSTDTLTNKRPVPRVVSATSYTTDTGTSLSFATCNEFVITAQAGALKFNNP